MSTPRKTATRKPATKGKSYPIKAASPYAELPCGDHMWIKNGHLMTGYLNECGDDRGKVDDIFQTLYALCKMSGHKIPVPPSD